MAKDDIGLIAPDEIAYRLELIPSELKLTYSALKASFNAYGTTSATFSGSSARSWTSCRRLRASTRSTFTSRAGTHS